MSYCSKCGFPIEPSDQFCRGCGTPVAAEAPAAPVDYSYNQQPDYSYNQQPDYSYNQPAYSYNQQPQPSGGSKASGFIGMGLAITGFVLALFGFIYTIISLEVDEAMAFGMSIGFGIFSLPLSIVGMKLSSNSRASGNTSAVCGVGKGLGLAGLILSCVMLFIGFVAFADTW